jgi:hypothetical protein
VTLLREPLTQFLLLGAALFAAFAVAGDRTRDESVVVASGRIEQLAAGFARTWQRPPTAGELERLIDDFVREEIHCREARAMGLDRDDTVVRRRLRQRMELLLEGAARVSPPSDEELRAYLLEHLDAFRIDPRFAIRQVFLSRDRRGDAIGPDARALLARLTAAGPDAEVASLGDPLMLPQELELTPRREVARLFGDGFAGRLSQLEPGRWTGPVESGYGLHLVLVRERVEARLPDLAEVRNAVARERLAARSKAAVEAAYRELRARYSIVVEQAGAGELAAVR